MSAQPLTSLHVHIMPFLPDCPPPLIDQTGIDIIRDSYTNTKAWTYSPDAINMVANQSTYVVPSLPAFAEIEDIISADLSGRCLWRGIHFDIANGNEFVFKTAPTANATAALKLVCSLTVKIDATSFDSSQFIMWKDAWIEGMLARLMIMPGKTWTQPEIGRVHGVNAYNLTANAKIKANQFLAGSVQQSVKASYKFA